MRAYDIVIIGGGPAGLAAAISAKKSGVDSVLILERMGCPITVEMEGAEVISVTGTPVKEATSMPEKSDASDQDRYIYRKSNRRGG